MDAFRHEELSNESRHDQIRVIELLPGSGTDRVNCNLSNVFLADSPCYEAISYCWGDVTDKAEISCDNKPLAITKSLYSALLHLRSESKSLALWADAICISQLDNRERSAQVRLMRQIYRKSQRVLIWLGEEANNSNLGMLLVPRLVCAYRRQYADDSFRSLWEMGKQGRHFYDIPPASDPAYRAIDSLLKRPWFRRVWIIQEVAVAPEALLMCGGHEVRWVEFALVAAYLMQLEPYPSDPRLWERSYQIELARRVGAGTVDRSLLELLVLYKTFEASDLRDKIYALCGLSNDAGTGALDVEIDYDREVEEVFKTVAISILKQTQELDVLSLARRVDESGSIPLPSWVPDWSTTDFSVSVRIRPEDTGVLLQHQATPFHLDASVDFTDAGNLLKLSGYVFDKIAELGHLNEPYVPATWLESFTKAQAYQCIFNSWEQVAQARSGIKYVTGEDIIDAYWQTLCAGYTPEGFSAAKDDFCLWDRVVQKRRRYTRMLDPKFFSWLLQILAFPIGFLIFMSSIKLGGSEKLKSFPGMMKVSIQRRVFRTKKGYIGLSPQLTRNGDCIGLFKGGMVPRVIRPEGSRWRLIGDCYVHGIMNGEVFEEEKCGTMWFI